MQSIKNKKSNFLSFLLFYSKIKEIKTWIKTLGEKLNVYVSQKNESFNSKYLNDDNHVKALLSKYEQLQKELNEVKNKQQEQDGRLDKSQERLDNQFNMGRKWII